MLNKIAPSQSYNNIQSFGIFKSLKAVDNPNKTSSANYNPINAPQNKLIDFNTTLNDSDKQKYEFLLNFLKDAPISPNSDGLTCNNQLDFLLKNGKLLAKTHNDKTTTLDNLYDIAVKKRAYDVSSVKIISDVLDLLVNPRYVTQQFGDIPLNEAQGILASQNPDSAVVKDPNLMNVQASGVCPAASLEVNAADKYPAEFCQWISKLSEENSDFYWQIDLKSINSNPLDALQILDILKTQHKDFNFGKNEIKISLDKNAYVREQIQAKYWDAGERNTADVLFQSAIMALGSQGTYDSLTDYRSPIFNENTQGLVEVEKTFVESIFKNKEITSLVYQQIDENQNLCGYTTTFDKIQKHIIDTLNSGDDVIIGYVLTNETAGRVNMSSYNPEVEGGPNKIINGHEITIVDYIQDKNGKTSFVCIDTDDDANDFVVYSADWLLPKIHHAGYPSEIVKDDEYEIIKKLVA